MLTAFQSTQPVWAATRGRYVYIRRPGYFNPRCPNGQRQRMARRSERLENFNPRCPNGQRLDTLITFITTGNNFNPRCPNGQRPTCSGVGSSGNTISIHAARMGSDSTTMDIYGELLSISIHAARMGSDPACWVKANPILQFQSTLPEWAAT